MPNFNLSDGLYAVIYLAAISIILVIVLLVIARQRTPLYRSFAIFGLLTNSWLALQFIAQLFRNDAMTSLLLLRGSIVASAYMAIFFVVFAKFYVGHPPKKKSYVVGFFTMLAIAVLGLSSTSVQTAKISSQGIAIETAGLSYTLVFIFTTLLFIYGLGTILRFALRKKQEKAVKAQALILFVSVAQALLFNAGIGFVLSEIPMTQLLVPVSCLLMIILITYAVVKHKLFDVRFFAVRALAYTITLTIAALLYVAPATLLTAFLAKTRLEPKILILLTLISFAVAFLFQPLKAYFNKITNRLFFRDYYNPQDVLDRLGSLLVGTVDVGEIKGQSAAIIAGALKPLFFEYFLVAESDKSNQLLRHLLESNLSIVVTDEPVGDGESQRVLYRELKSKEIALAIRLQTKQEDLGFILLGFKQSGALYTTSDRRLLGVIAGEIAISLQNALRFEEIQRFNQTLQDKIEEATRQLRRTNDKLRKLDETKDDFISMASHQLRTPLTSVKGYVSMVLDGDAGQITKLQRKLLTQSFISSQRMVYLISDLLNVSRLKTGKFIIEPVKTNLAQVIDEEIGQLQETAKGRNLTLEYRKPEHFPTLLMDETKIRQVIMNFIDNAVYYTPSGGHITINLVDRPKAIEFTVVDTGIGVPRHEQHHLFSKFYRANNAKRARPDGTGLGLFMAKKVIIAQGGAVVFKSQEGRGSTFGFVFPKTKLVAASSSLLAPSATPKHGK